MEDRQNADPRWTQNGQHRTDLDDCFDLDNGFGDKTPEKIPAESQFSIPDPSGDAPLCPLRPNRLGSLCLKDACDDAVDSTEQGEVQTRPYVLKTPKKAPAYQDKSISDFAPWDGLKQEDSLTENSVKSGYYDKIHISNGEMSSARPFVWSSMKHKPGLLVLSSVFVSVFEQRQTASTIKLKGNFKPPPRVTLTDTRREAWLKDLSDRSIPLRKLSRTIPHGVKGRMLLDHCLSKEIPLLRAMWLVKCVGANEIRAFRRKGASASFISGGARQWTVEWTSLVEQFLEDIVKACGIAANWKQQMTYGLRFVVCLAAEQLMNLEHFLDWMAVSLRESHPDLLPIWLLVICVIWTTLELNRKHGKLLAQALLDQLLSLRAQTADDTECALLQLLLGVISDLMDFCDSCFFFPQDWTKYEHILQPYLLALGQERGHKLEQSFRRNSRFVHATKNKTLERSPPSRRKLISILDHSCVGVELSELSELSNTLLSCSKNLEPLIDTTLRWATTRYRSGLARVYLATRLLRYWKIYGIDSHWSAMSHLERASSDGSYDESLVFKLIAELVRTNDFSLSRYLQWLIARGVPGNNTSHFFLKLLNNIPLYGLPEHVQNLRCSLLSNVSCFKDVAQCSQRVQEPISKRFRKTVDLFRANDSRPPSDVRDHETASRFEQFELAHWIQQSVFKRLFPPHKAKRRSRRSALLSLSFADFRVLRGLLEEFQDFAVLANIFGMIAKAGPSNLFVPVLDSVHTYFEIFGAIGIPEEIFIRLMSHLDIVAANVPAAKRFLLGMVDLSRRLPRQANAHAYLCKFVEDYEPKMPVLAYSPVSEHDLESLQDEEANFVEDLEALLNNSSAMSQSLISRVFSSVTTHIEAKQVGRKSLNFARLANSLLRLRALDVGLFDGPILEWGIELSNKKGFPSLDNVLGELICHELTTFEKYLEYVLTTKKAAEYASLETVTKTLSIFLLHLNNDASNREWPQDPEIAHMEDQSEAPRFYIYAGQVYEVLLARGELVFAIFNAFCELSAEFDMKRSSEIVLPILRHPAFPQLLQLLLSKSYQPQQLMACLCGSIYRSVALEILIRVLVCTQSDYRQQPAPELYQSSEEDDQSIAAGLLEKVLRYANNFNIRLCQMVFLMIMEEPEQGHQENIRSDERINVLLEAVKYPQNIPEGTLQELFACLGHLAATKLYEGVLATILSSLYCVMEDGMAELDLPATESDDLMTLLETLETLCCKASSESVPFMARSLAESVGRFQLRLRQHSDVLTTDNENLGNLESPAAKIWLESCTKILVRVLRIHWRLFDTQVVPQNYLQQIVFNLCLIMVTPALPQSGQLTEEVFDTITFLSDFLSNDSRQQCYEDLKLEENQDSPFNFLFGAIDTDIMPSLIIRLSTSKSELHGTDIEDVRSSDQERSGPFPLRQFEMVQDAAPTLGNGNEDCLNLALLSARK